MPNGSGLFNAYNQNVGETEKNIPPTNDVTAESFDSKKANLLDKIQHAKIGTLVAYTKGQGTIVKKDGAYLTVFNEAAGEYDQVHVGETYIPGDMISMGVMNQLWDQMQQEVRMGLLSKANIQQPLHFVSRSWNELPKELREVIKEHAKYNSSVPGKADDYYKGVPIKELGTIGRQMYDKEQKEKKEKENKLNDKKASDVEHGLYGGVVSTDTNFDAEDEYEEDHREGDRKQVKYDRLKEPEAPEPTVVRAKEKAHKLTDDDAPQGEGETGSVGEEHATHSTPDKYNRLGSKNPFDRNLIRRKKNFVNRNNTRYGMRQASDEEVENFFLNKDAITGKQSGKPKKYTIGIDYDDEAIEADYVNTGADPVVGHYGGKPGDHSSFQAASTNARLGNDWQQNEYKKLRNATRIGDEQTKTPKTGSRPNDTWNKRNINDKNRGDTNIGKTLKALNEELKAKRESAPGANEKLSVEHRYGGGYGNSGMRRTFMPGDKKIIGTFGNTGTSFDKLHNAKENKKETTEPKSAVGRARKYYDLDGNQISAKEYKEQFG